MKQEEKSRIVKGTSIPPEPDPETLKREQEKREQEKREKEVKEKEGEKDGRGRKSKLVKAAEEEQKTKVFREKCRKAGRACCNSLVMGGYTFLGPEWAYIPPFKIDPDNPDSPVVDEKIRMETAYEDMFEEYGWDILPAWLPVLTVTGGYIVSRVRMPTVQERFKNGFFSNIKKRFSEIGKKKEETKS